jgi:hypothetical protein
VLETIEGAEQTAASKAPVLYRLCQHLIYINTSVAWAAGSSVNRTIAPRLKCEQDLVMIELNCEKKLFFKFKLNSNDKNDSKFNISTTVGLKIMKSPPRRKPHSSRTFQQYQLFVSISLILILLTFFDKIVQYSITLAL